MILTARPLLAICALLAGALACQAEEVADAPGAILRGLDKMSSQITDLSIKNGDTVTFGTLSVSVSDCRYPANDPAANAYAHVMISDATGATDFDGWMIASSPALSALDHPRYDVWVLRCMSN
jgi:hypothetical protein